MQDKISVLYVDDESHNLNSFKASFRREFTVYIAQSAAEATQILKQDNDIQIIISDQRMPGITGVEFLESTIEAYPDAIRILLTGYADINAVIVSPAPAQHAVRFGKAARHDPGGAPNLAGPAGQSAARGRQRRRRGE